MGKGKSKSKRRVVRGPQQRLKLEPVRNARIRYVEPPNKKDGRPFFAFRAAPELLKALAIAAAKKGKYRTEWAREVLAKAAGFKLEAEDE